MTTPTAPHFSMIRGFHVADLFTLGNGACGVAAVFQAIDAVRHAPRRASDLWIAAILVVLAVVFDFLDGRVARFRHTASSMGRELDSLADVISFGVAPAAIALASGLDAPLDRAILLFFSCCGLSRLARYNVTAAALSGPEGKVRYFEGTPITFSIFPLLLLVARGRAARERSRPRPAGPLPDPRLLRVGMPDDLENHPHPEAVATER
ncbi:MAG: CDP-alcohol phosphatidyltransferase family protein [Acidobacteriota bacterium]